MELTQENLPIFLAIFAVVTVFFIIILIIISVKQKKKKKELLSDPNNVEIIFDAPVILKRDVVMNPGQTCYVVQYLSDETATFVDRSIITNAQTLTIEVEHYQLPLNKNFAKSIGQDSVTIQLEKGKKYHLSFDYIDKKLDVVGK